MRQAWARCTFCFSVAAFNERLGWVKNNSLL
jgi:hypothetical protein